MTGVIISYTVLPFTVFLIVIFIMYIWQLTVKSIRCSGSHVFYKYYLAKMNFLKKLFNESDFVTDIIETPVKDVIDKISSMNLYKHAFNRYSNIFFKTNICPLCVIINGELWKPCNEYNLRVMMEFIYSIERSDSVITTKNTEYISSKQDVHYFMNYMSDYHKQFFDMKNIDDKAIRVSILPENLSISTFWMKYPAICFYCMLMMEKGLLNKSLFNSSKTQREDIVNMIKYEYDNNDKLHPALNNFPLEDLDMIMEELLVFDR